MANLTHNDSHQSINSFFNLFNAENVDVRVKHSCYEQFYPQQLLSENIHLKIYSNEGYLMDLSSTFTHLLVIVKKFDNEIHCLIDGISYENCLWHILFCQISVYINATLVSTINNFSNYGSYVLFILMTSESYRKLSFSANGYPYKTDTGSTDALKHEAICELHLVVNKIFNKPQCLPPNIIVDIQITLALSNFISRKELPTLPNVTVPLISALLHV